MTGSLGGIQSLSLWSMHKAMTSSQGISATEGPAPWRGERLLLLHLACVLWSRLSTWDWRTGRVWGQLGIWDAYWTTMAHTGSQGAGEKHAGSYEVSPPSRWKSLQSVPPCPNSEGSCGAEQSAPEPE